MKQPSTDRHVAPLGHIIHILTQPVFDLKHHYLTEYNMVSLGYSWTFYHLALNNNHSLIILFFIYI
jgi:hypothetical protein